jgi:tetratricopeptide (TPR) repeat protein
MKLKVLALALIMINVAGCASNKVWIKDGTDAKQAQMDLNECKYESSKSSFVAYGKDIDPISAGVQEGFQSANLLNQCMRAKGYYLTDKSELERKNYEQNRLLNAWQQAIKDKEYDKALIIANETINKYPNMATPYYGRANSYFMLKKYNEAISDYNKAISLGYKDVQIFVLKSQSFLYLYEYDIAIETLDQALDYKKDSSLFNLRAYAFYKKGDYDKALDDCNKAIALDYSKPNPFKNRGLAYLGKGQYNKAIEQFNKSISIDPTYAYAYSGRGETLLKLGKTENALLDFKKACEHGDKESCNKFQ